MKIILEPINSPGILAAKIWIKGGSSKDRHGKKGAHHLLASVATRGCGPFNNIDLGNLVEGCGAGLRCDALEDGLLISLKCINKDANQLLPILGWMITNAHLNSEQIKLERELSLQALQRHKENPFQLAFDGWRQLAYGNGPYGHDPLGLIDDVKTITRKELLPIGTGLKERNKIMVIAGSLPNNLEDYLKEVEPFNQLINQQTKQIFPLEKIKFFNKEIKKSSNISLQPQSTEQIVLMMGEATVPHGHVDDLPLRLLGTHLGSGMSSLLFRKFREEHGVAYDVGIHHPSRQGASPFLIHISTSVEKSLLTLELLIKTWDDLKDRPLSDEELELARGKFCGQMAHNAQTVNQRAERKVQLYSLGLKDNYDIKSKEEIKNISSKDIQNVARKYLNEPLLSLCGPEKTINHLAKKWEEHFKSF